MPPALDPSANRAGRPRVAVFTDYVYRQDGTKVYGERAFQLFVVALRPHVARLVLVGRLEPVPGRWHYEVPADLEFVPLPHYESLMHGRRVLAALGGAVRRFWRVLDDVEVVWVLGPNPTALAFALTALARRRRVVLGVRQDLPRMIAHRHPGRRALRAVAWALEAAWRALALRCPVVVVGPELARAYRRSRTLVPIAVSLVSADDLVSPEAALERWDDGELRVLSVGRLEEEKNPLVLAEVLARLRERDDRWRLVVCGDGPLADALAARLDELGVAGHAELRGYVPHAGLRDVYRGTHALLHVSRTEGLPQVLFEAFAAGVPVVATAVGGIPAAAGDAALLVEPGDPGASAQQLERLAADATLRDRLVRAGAERARAHTLESEVAKVAAALSGASAGG